MVTLRFSSYVNEDLTMFSLRMSDLGFSVSRTLMVHDQAYALEQLRFAHASTDLTLRQLAVKLFERLRARPHS